MAATATVYIAVSCQSRSGTDLAQKLAAPANEPHKGVHALAAFLERVLGGTEPARVYFAVDAADGTAGTCTVTCTGANYTAGETLTICGVVFTVVAAYSSELHLAQGQLITGETDANAGETLKNKINRHPLLKGLVTATDNGSGVVTLTCKDKHLLGNLAVLAETGDAFAVTQVTNAAEGTLTASLRAYDKS